MGRSGGRPRKPGVRYPSGDLRKKPAEGIAPALWGRIRSIVAKVAGDGKLESEVGRLAFLGEFTNVQAAAAFKVGDIYRAYHRTKRLKDFPKSPNYEQGFGSADLAEERMSDEQLANFEDTVRRAHQAWERIDGAYH